MQEYMLIEFADVVRWVQAHNYNAVIKIVSMSDVTPSAPVDLGCGTGNPRCTSQETAHATRPLAPYPWHSLTCPLRSKELNYPERIGRGGIPLARRYDLNGPSIIDHATLADLLADDTS